MAAHFDEPVEHDVLAGGEDVAEEWLVQPVGAQRAVRVTDQCLENLEARTARRTQPAAENAPDDRCRLPRLQ